MVEKQSVVIHDAKSGGQTIIQTGVSQQASCDLQAVALAGLAKQIRCVPVCVTKQQYEVESHEQPQTGLHLNNRFIGLFGVGTSPSGGHRPVAQSQSDGMRCEQHPFAAIEHSSHPQ